MKIEKRQEFWKEHKRYLHSKGKNYEIWRIRSLDLEKKLEQFKKGKCRNYEEIKDDNDR